MKGAWSQNNARVLPDGRSQPETISVLPDGRIEPENARVLPDGKIHDHDVRGLGSESRQVWEHSVDKLVAGVAAHEAHFGPLGHVGAPALELVRGVWVDLWQVPQLQVPELEQEALHRLVPLLRARMR